MSPTVNAGTNDPSNDILTITGYGFGNKKGSGNVQLTDANHKSTSLITLDDSDYVSWSENQIQIKMPSYLFGSQAAFTPGSGPLNVTNDCGAIDISTLHIYYNIMGISNISYTKKYRKNIVKAPSISSGSYIFRCDSASMAMNPQAKSCIDKALKEWNCKTGVNWQLSNDINFAMDTADGISNIFFSNSLSASNAIAETQTHIKDSCSTATDVFNYEADINIRQDLNAISTGLQWSYDTIGSTLGLYEVGFYDMILHELGHAHLLNHINDANDVMYYNDTHVNRLNLDFSYSAIDGGLDVVNKSSIVNLGTCSLTLMTKTSPTCNTSAVTNILGNLSSLNVFPNPVSSGDITISFQLSKSANIQFKIVDYTGREIIALSDEHKTAGTYSEQINIEKLAQGIYLFTANINGEYHAIKFIKL